MSDRFYRLITTLGRPAIRRFTQPTVLGLEHVQGPGPLLIACSHQSPFDVPILIQHCPTPIDFVSITEVFEHPVLGWFYGAMNAFPLDRNRVDPKTIRIILSRLKAGRVIGMFPEGGFRHGDHSVLNGGTIRPGIGRIAAAAGVRVVPAAVFNAAVFRKPSAYLPFAGTRYGLSFGPPLDPPAPHGPQESRRTFKERCSAFEADLGRAIRSAYAPIQGIGTAAANSNT